MKRSRYIVSSFDCSMTLIVEGSSDFHESLQNHAFWHEFIPGFRFQESTQSPRSWRVVESATFTYDLEGCSIQATQKTIKQVIVIIEAVFEKMRQEDGLYTLHGCVIARNDRAVALVGNLSGIGKTTLASYAATRGWTWLSDEKFTLSGTNVIGGTRGILDDDKTREAAQGTIPMPTRQKYRLALICQPLVTSETVPTTHALSDDRAQWALYDEVTRDIRQVNGTLGLSVTPLPSFDTSLLAHRRQNDIATLIASVPVFYIRGNKKAILDQIETTLTAVE